MPQWRAVRAAGGTFAGVLAFGLLCASGADLLLGHYQVDAQFLNANSAATNAISTDGGVTSKGPVNAEGGLRIGGGDLITAHPRGSATLDFASALVATCSADLTISVTSPVSAAVGGEVTLGAPAARPAGSKFEAWVSATGVVSVRHCCHGAVACNPVEASYSARVSNP